MTDPAEPARRAEHLTPEDMPMRMTTVDYSWQYPPRQPEPERTSPLVFVMIGLIVALISLMAAHVLVKAVAKAAAFNAGLLGAW
jgi:hypothetical protein